MSRLSIRPRPLDIHKKLPIVKSIKDLEDDETPTSTRNSHLLHLVVQAEVEHASSSKKLASEIPIPQFVIVDTYEKDYACTFSQPASYLRARGARSEIGEFVEYDLDNEDEDWLELTIKEKKHISSEKLELILFKLEVLDHKAREKAGLMAPTLGSPVPVLLQFESAFEALQAIPNLSVKYGALQSIFSYWKQKREQWQKPVLRRLQPPPPVNDTNPFNVFRRREKLHKHHTRRMQRREDGVHSFEKLRQVRRNLGQAKMLLESLIKREEKKREFMENEVGLQRIQLKYKNETELLEDAFALTLSYQGNFGSSEDESVDSDMNQDLRLDPLEPVLMFIKPLDREMLSTVGVVPPADCCCNGRIGRGGRIIFDRWNPVLQCPLVDTTTTTGNHPLHLLQPKPSQAQPFSLVLINL